jgi:hypothetical protein
MTDFIVEDFDFDSVPDASEFRPFPTGAYRVKLVGKADSSEKDGVTKKFINVQAELLEIVETSAEENLPKAGDITGQRYYIFSGKDNGEFARSMLKKIAAPIGAAIGATGLQAFLQAISTETGGLQGVLVVKEKPNTYNGRTTMQNEFVNFTLD